MDLYRHTGKRRQPGQIVHKMFNQLRLVQSSVLVSYHSESIRAFMVLIIQWKQLQQYPTLKIGLTRKVIILPKSITRPVFHCSSNLGLGVKVKEMHGSRNGKAPDKLKYLTFTHDDKLRPRTKKS